jgi:uncharacterized 2Fe-2S/4Fe-4S cluster protein (DUF4445 family)
MQKITKVVFLPDGKRGEALLGDNLLKTAGKLGVDINSLCGGFGTCGKCKIVLVQGRKNLNDFTSSEKNFLSDQERERGYRLACQAVLEEAGDLVIEIPAESRTGKQILQIEGIGTEVKLDPSVKKMVVKVPPPNLENAKADAERLLETLERQFSLKNIKLSPQILKKLPIALRRSDSTISVTLWRDEITSGLCRRYRHNKNGWLPSRPNYRKSVEHLL